MTHTPAASTSRQDPLKLRRDAQRNRILLLAAAREMFAESGLNVTMDTVARRAGVGVGTAYRHFANKYELANAIFDDVVEHLVASAERVQSAPDAWTALCEILEQTLAAQDGNRAIREMILAVNQDDWVHHDSLLAPLRVAFDRAKAVDVIRADVTFADLTVMLIMLCSLSNHVGDVAPHLWRRYLPTMLHSLSAPGVPMPGVPLSESRLRAALVTGLLAYRAN